MISDLFARSDCRKIFRTVIESFSPINFKSFRHAELPLSSLTVLVGANASGKSNLLEGLQLLSWLAQGRRLHELQTSIRDGDLVLRGTEYGLGSAGATFLARVSDSELGPLDLRVSIERSPDESGLRIASESLFAPMIETESPLYSASVDDDAVGALTIEYNNFSRGRKPHIQGVNQLAVFTQLTSPARFDARHGRSQQVIPQASVAVQKALESIRFLDPAPAEMRTYSFKNDVRLHTTGRNISAVAFRLCQTHEGKGALLDFVRALPEQEFTDMTFIETPRNEVMLQLCESFGGTETPRDAGVLSDGTLRVLAVAAALLSASSGELVVIEELDNGVHPSRARHLVEQIQKTATQRNIRVLLTTHNPALMSALTPEALNSVVVCHRDSSGHSALTRLSALSRFPELLSQGRLGDVATRGLLEQHIKKGDDPVDYQAFFDALESPLST